MVQLRLKMKLSKKCSKWTVTNSSFFMRALKWRGSLWRTSLWSCQFYVMMCLDGAPEELPSPIFYMLSLCLHFIACSHLRQCAFQMWWEDLEKKKYVSCFCLMFTIFLYLLLFFCFCIMFSFCVCICFLFVVLSIFYICMLFLFFLLFFLFFCICFVLLLFLLF